MSLERKLMRTVKCCISNRGGLHRKKIQDVYCCNLSRLSDKDFCPYLGDKVRFAVREHGSWKIVIYRKCEYERR